MRLSLSFSFSRARENDASNAHLLLNNTLVLYIYIHGVQIVLKKYCQRFLLGLS